jgi:hypothetical protein
MQQIGRDLTVVILKEFTTYTDKANKGDYGFEA